MNKKEFHCNLETIQIPYNPIFPKRSMSIPADGSTVSLTSSISVNIEIHTKDATIPSDDEDVKLHQSMEERVVEFHLSSKESFSIVQDYVRDRVREYEVLEKAKSEAKCMIVKPALHSSSTEYPVLIPFESTKTFDTMFFDEKDVLLHRLNMFRDGSTYKRLGIPHMLGLLFYGEPGTGKTSAIKAIANYMNMSLILVPMNLIKTRKQLESLFYSDNMSLIPYNKRIYVFEEIDCNGWGPLVTDRRFRKEEEPEGETQLERLLTVLEDEKSTIRMPKKRENKDDALTLGAILEVLDGITETTGRIVIMTTNHREKLDPALVRPGRIDMEIEFKKLRGSHIASIYEKWYGIPYVGDALPDYKYTQADVSQMLFRFEKDPKEFVREIIDIQ